MALRCSAVAGALAVAFIWFVASVRIVAIPAFGALVIASLVFIGKGGRAWWLGLWLATLGLCAVPIDITFTNLPGPPRFVPLVKGLPSHETYELAKRGEVLLGGCSVTGNEPKWVWVW